MRIKLAVPISAIEISAALGVGNLQFDEISHIATDSREAEEGDLFISLSEDGSKSATHIKEAKGRGAVTLGVGGDIDAPPRRALLSLAGLYKTKLPQLEGTVMITGSVGKTTTKEILYRITSACFVTHKNDGNFNNDIGLPLTLLSAPADCKVLILEAGMNHTGEISALSRCAKPSVSVITAIGTSHIGNLGSREAIAHAKLEVLDGMRGGVLLCDAEEPLLRDAKMRVTFSTKSRYADYSLLPNGKGKISDYLLYTPGGKVDMRIPTVFIPFATDIIAAAAAAHTIGVSNEDIVTALSRLDGGVLRHRVIKTDRLVLLDDSYNSSLEALRAAIDLLISYGYPRPTALLCDVLELGEYATDIHKSVGEYAAVRGVMRLYLCGRHANDVKLGAMQGGMPEEDILIFDPADNLSNIAEFIINDARVGEMLLIKGSHATGIHKIIDYIKGGKND